jgi:protein TonB
VTRTHLLYLASFGAHLALAAGVVSIKGAKIYEDVSVAVFEKAKAEPAKAKPPPPEPPPEAPKAAAKVAKAAAPKVAPPPPADAPAPAGPASGADIPDFGLSLGGGTGGGGLALPAGGAKAAAPAASVQVSKKVLGAPAATAAETCAEPPTKPKVVSITQPAYTPEAREANIAGRVRVELTVDATGHVSSARVLEGLGHGLDEAALVAARAATFEAGTRCGKAAPTTFVISMRFTL